MRRTTQLSTITLATLALLWFATPSAEAQVRWSPDRRGWDGGGAYGARVGRGFQRGFEDGHRGGRGAARDGRRYDPCRERRFRDADRGYRPRFGPIELYRQDYRQGFRAGYERGYREAHRWGRDRLYFEFGYGRRW